MQQQQYYATGAGQQFGHGRMLSNEDQLQHLSAVGLQGRKNVADQQAQQAAIEAQRAMEAQRQAGETQRARIGARASTAGVRADQDRFNTVFPWLQGQLGQLGSAMFNPVGGQSPPSPDITVGPIWDGSQVQQQVNAARAGGDQATQSRIATMQKQTAGKGFGANSPLAQALGAGMMNQNLATNMDAERGIRWDAAEGNAGHVLKTQQAREQQFASRQEEDIARRRTQMQGYSALVAALSGLA